MKNLTLALLLSIGMAQAFAQYNITPGQATQQIGPFSAVGQFSVNYEITQTASGAASIGVLGWYSCQSAGGRGAGSDCFFINWSSIALLDANGNAVGMFTPEPYGNSTTQTQWVNSQSALPAGTYTLKLVGNSEYAHNGATYESWKGYGWLFLQ